MSVKVATNLPITSSIKRCVGFYQHLVSNVSSFQQLGNLLVRQADIARGFRHSEMMEEAGIILSNIPIKEYRLIGQYYVGWASYLKGEAPQAMLEHVAEYSETYKAKAFVSLAAIEARKGDCASELMCFNEALRYAKNISTRIESLRAIAVVKAKEGFHPQSLKDLENMLPAARYADLRVYHDYLNSYAVELAEVGRIEEASNISRLVLASPFITAYPEWLETHDYIKLRGYKSRSVISFAQKNTPKNLVHLPEREPSSSESAPLHKARVLNLLEWKKKMGKEPNGDNEPKDEKDLFFEAMEIFSSTKISEKKKWKMLEIIRKIANEPDDPTG